MQKRRVVRALATLALLGGAAGCAPAAPPAVPAAPAVEVPAAEAAPAAVTVPEPGQVVPEANVRALVEACVAPRTGDVERARIVQYLGSIKSKAGERCYAEALRGYKPGVTEETLAEASKAVGALRLTGASGALFEAFTKVRASKLRVPYREVFEAMLAISDPAWEAQLVAYVEHPADMKDMSALTDEMFWQMTAAVILGQLRSAAAARPLLRALLTPAKAAMHVDAVLALVRIGKPAAAAATTLLKKGDPELSAYAEQEARTAGTDPTADVGIAALVLATMGRSESTGTLIDALATPDLVARAVIARELTRLPRDPRTVAAYRGVVEKLPLSVQIPNMRGTAHEVLLDKADGFFDASLVPWLAEDAKRLTGDAGDVRAARDAAMSSALKLARADQVKHIDAIAGLGKRGATVGLGFEKEIKATKELLAACGDRLDCWFDKLTDPGAQTDAEQFRGIKSAYMIGVLGDAAARDRLVKVLPRIMHPGVRFAALMAIDVLSPQGDAATADALQAMVDEAIAAHDQARMRLNSPLKTEIVRLRARLP
ncbi:MAG: hypothetical protein QM820_49465 [Minicystis sp.]